MTACKAVFMVENRVQSPEICWKYDLNPAAWVLPGKINAMKNCAHCNRGLTILSGEVNVRVIVLLSLFDRM